MTRWLVGVQCSEAAAYKLPPNAGYVEFGGDQR